MGNKKSENERSEYSLMIEGAKSYPQALAALSEFRHLVVHACREAFERDLIRVSCALGVRISRQELLDRQRPDSPDGADAVNAQIGIRIDRRREGWRLYYCLAWSKTSKRELWAQLVVRFTGRDRALIYDALEKVRRPTQYKYETARVATY